MGMYQELTADQAEVVDAQGWNEDTVLSFALRFLHDQKLSGAFAAYLTCRAAEENVECVDGEEEEDWNEY